MRDGYIKITSEIINEIQRHRKRTGVSMSSVARELNISQSVVSSWLTGRYKSAHKDTIDKALSIWRRAPDRKDVEITSEIINEIRGHIKRTGVNMSSVARELDISQSVVGHWLHGRIKSADKETIDKALNLWRGFPDRKDVEITPEIIEFIRKEIERTGKGQSAILRGNDEAKEIKLTSTEIKGILNGSIKRMDPDLLDFILDLWKNAPDKEDVPKKSYVRPRNTAPITQEYINHINSEIERTGLSPQWVLRGAGIKKPVHTTVNVWLTGTRKRASKKQLDLLSDLYSKLPDSVKAQIAVNTLPKASKKENDAQPIKYEDLAKLRKLRSLTSVVPSTVVKHSSRVPRGVDSRQISRWLNGGANTASTDHVKWVLKSSREILEEALRGYESLALENFHDVVRSELKPIEPEKLEWLKKVRDLTGVLPSMIFENSKNKPKGLNSAKISSWLNRGCRACPKNVNWVVNRCEEILKEALCVFEN